MHRSSGQQDFVESWLEHKGRRARLKAAGIKDRIMHRSHKNQAGLPRWQARRNRLISPIRAAVERVFGTLNNHGGLAFDCDQSKHCLTPSPVGDLCATLARRQSVPLAFDRGEHGADAGLQGVCQPAMAAARRRL